MAENTFRVAIITPDGIVYDNGKVIILVMNTVGGQMGIMASHVPLIAALEINAVRIKHSGGTDEVAAVNSGTIQFDGQNATITADNAEMPKAIDVGRVQRARERSESAIEEAKRKHNQSDLSHAEVHLKRTINRSNAASEQHNI